MVETEAVVEEIYEDLVMRHWEVFPNLHEVLVNQAYLAARAFKQVRRV